MLIRPKHMLRAFFVCFVKILQEVSPWIRSTIFKKRKKHYRNSENGKAFISIKTEKKGKLFPGKFFPRKPFLLILPRQP